MLESVRSRAVLSGVVVGVSPIAFRVDVDPGIAAEPQMEYFCSGELNGVPARFRVRCTEAGALAVFHTLGGAKPASERPTEAVSTHLDATLEWGGIPIPAELTHLSHRGAGFRARSRLDAGDQVTVVAESPWGVARLEAQVKLVRGPTSAGKYVGWLELCASDRISRARWLRLVAEGDPLIEPPASPKKKGRRSTANRSRRSASL